MRSLFLILFSAVIFFQHAPQCFATDSKPEKKKPVFKSPLLLRTNHLWIATHKTINLNLAFATRSQWQAPLSGLQGSLQQLALMRVDFGVAPNMIIQIRGAIRQRLAIDTEHSAPIAGVPQSGSTNDSGDFTIATIMRVFEDEAQKTVVGFRAEMKLPNTTQKKGIGPNTTDVYLTILTSSRIGRLLLFSDLGIGILTAPIKPDEQNDVLAFGFGAAYSINNNLHLGGEINGFLVTRNIIPKGTEARSAARFGATLQWQSFEVEFMLVHGLTKNEGRLGWMIGLSRRIGI